MNSTTDQLNLIDTSNKGQDDGEINSQSGSIVLLNGSTTFGSLGRLFCPNGTIMFGLGNRIIQCQENGFWSKLGTFCLSINRTNGKKHERVMRLKKNEEKLREREKKQQKDNFSTLLYIGYTE